MGLSRSFFLSFFFLLTIFTCPNNGQIIFKELPQYKANFSDSTFFGTTQTRKVISLDGTWKVFPSAKKEDQAVEITVPSIFQGNGSLIFEKHFYLTKNQVENHRLKLSFLGLNYSADISVNGVIIYRQTGGEFPFEINLPKDILKEDENNLLSVKLYYKLDSENTIPVKQRFLFPKNYGGILRDVFIIQTPDVSINNFNISYNYSPTANKAKIDLYARIENRDFNRDTLNSSPEFTLKVKFVPQSGGSVQYAPDNTFQLSQNRNKDVNESFEITAPDVWSPSSPQSYFAYVELWRGTSLIDREVRNVSFYSLTSTNESLNLNGRQFSLNGVTYIPSFQNYGNLESYQQMDQDIKMIKELGFNCVRFEKGIPHPYYLSLCEKYGLLAFVELPLNGIPSEIIDSKNFTSRSENYLTNFLNAYRKYSAIAAVGLGDSYISQPSLVNPFISKLAGIIKSETNFLTYASFSKDKISPIDNLDLYGLEFLNAPVSGIIDRVKAAQDDLGAGKVFISEATYLVNAGNTDGYVNDFSFEAQAKYFQDLLDYTANNPLAGFFINSMFDYRGDYASLSAGYSKDNLYQLGICSEDRSTDRLGYKVVYSVFHNTDKVTIPIGNKKDHSPMIFILAGLLLAIALGILVNSGRKFREDASRALLRPYNFFADVRDMRIMSGPQSTFLAVIVSITSALILSNMLFYLRENIFIEKLILSFGSSGMMATASYLAWHPIQSLVWLTIVSIMVLVAITIIVKAASFFVRNRVFLSSAYFAVIWSFLPIVLLIPVGIVLFRLLNADIANIYIYIGLILFMLWIFYRLMKGIYVIFDVNSGSVYFYSILILLVLFGGMLIYYQVKNSAFDYIQLTLKQFNILG